MDLTRSDNPKKSFSITAYRMDSYRRLSTVLALILIPFIVNAFFTENWLVVIVGIAVALILMVNIISLHKNHCYAIEPAIATLVMLPGILILIYHLGLIGILWSYPVVGMLYFIHARNVAALFSIFLVGCIIPISYSTLGLEVTIRVAVTLGITAIFSNIFLKILEQQQEQVNQLLITDPLTGAYNRRYFDERTRLSFGLREREICETMIMLDIDHFKKVNDRYGHEYGDKILIRLVDLLAQRVRDADALFRLGGEEFAILLSAASIQQGQRLAEELRAMIEKNLAQDEDSITCSIGVAELDENESIDSWMRRCDQALYNAKNNGSNRVELPSNGVS